MRMVALCSDVGLAPKYLSGKHTFPSAGLTVGEATRQSQIAYLTAELFPK